MDVSLERVCRASLEDQRAVRRKRRKSEAANQTRFAMGELQLQLGSLPGERLIYAGEGVVVRLRGRTSSFKCEPTKAPNLSGMWRLNRPRP